MEQITVEMLFKLCMKAMNNGHGKKNIVISDDNEGNGYHGLFYGFTPVDEEMEFDIYDSQTHSADDTIILG